PGTVTEPALLDAQRNNYLAALAVAPDGGRAGLAHVDITTGEFAAVAIHANELWAAVRHELLRLAPAELLVPSEPGVPALDGVACPHTTLSGWKFEQGNARN